jgi:hypothetical protein
MCSMKARDHRQRRAQLVGDVGDEIAAHRLRPFDLRHVEADEQLAVLAEADRLDRQDAALAVRRPIHQRCAFAGAGDELGEAGQADQVRHQQADIALAAQAEMLFRNAVAPDDVVGGVEEHQAVGRGLRRLAENLQVGLDARARLALAPQHAVELDEDIAPGAPGIGNVALLGCLEPALQARQVGRLHGQHQQQDAAGDRHAGDSAEQGADDQPARATATSRIKRETQTEGIALRQGLGMASL